MESPSIGHDSLRVPFGRPHLWGRESEYVNQALDGSWLSAGPFVERFEQAVTSFVGTAHGLATSNGTMALVLALLGLGLAQGDEVVVPSYGFMAAANVAMILGLVVKFADVDPFTWCVTGPSVAAAAGPDTKCVVATHTYGNMADIHDILEWAAPRNIAVIEDAAESLGSSQRGAQSGSVADVGIYSFHAAKAVTTGEGGFVTTNDPEVHDRMRILRSHGIRARHYWHETNGLNARMSNLHAAVGVAQMEEIERIDAARRLVEVRYRQKLARVDRIELQVVSTGTDAVMWAVAVRLLDTRHVNRRDEIMDFMSRRGVETRPGFPSSSQLGLFGSHSSPVADMLADSIIVLPTPPTLTEAEIELAVSTLETALATF